MKASTSFWIGAGGAAVAIGAFFWGRKAQNDAVAAANAAIAAAQQPTSTQTQLAPQTPVAPTPTPAGPSTPSDVKVQGPTVGQGTTSPMAGVTLNGRRR